MKTEQKQNDKSSFAEGLVILALVLAAVGSMHAHALKMIYEENCEKLFFPGYLLVLYFIYKSLRTNFDASKDARKSILKTQALREVKASRQYPKAELRSYPVPDFRSPRKPKISEIKIGTRLSDGRPVYLSDEKRTTHAQVLGATGRGKTESVILPWMVQDYLHAKNVVLIDGKGDPNLMWKFRSYTQTDDNKHLIKHFDPVSFSSCVVNPLAWGTPLQVSDRIMSSFEFKDPYYKAIQSEGLLTVISLLQANQKEVTFRAIDRAFRDIEVLSELSQKSKDDALKLKARSLLNLKESERLSQFSGLLSQLSLFVTGEVADHVNGKSASLKPLMSITEVMSGGGSDPQAALILIPTLIYPEAGRVLGRMFLQEVAFNVGKRCSSGISNEFTSVFLDEFGSFAYTGFEQILNKARSANVALHLSHQSSGDLERVSPEFAKVVNTNTNIKCLLGLNDPDTADFFARHMGTETKTKSTERVDEVDSLFGKKDERTGQKSMRETEVYKIHPNRLKNLNAGEGVIHIPGKPDAVTEEIQFHDVIAHGFIERELEPLLTEAEWNPNA